MEKRSAGSMPSARSLRPNSLISLVQGLGIKVPTDCASGKYEKEPASLSVSADLANPSANSRLPLGSPKSFHSPRLKSSRSISPINPRSPAAAKAIGVSPSFRPTTAQKPAGSLPKHSSEGKTNVSASAVKNYPPALPAKKPQSTPKTASSPKAALSTSASQPIKPVSPPVLKKKDSDAPAPAPSLSPQAQRELEASKNMVSPRIEFDAARAASAAQRPEPQAPKRKVVSRGKEIKNKVLQSLVTKVGDTAEPGDQGKSKAEIIYRKHLYQTFRGLKMARSLPLADPVQIQAKRVVLMKPPGKYRRKTAIFDLDETLVHCLDRTEPSVPDVVLPIRFPNGEIVHANIKIRPYCLQCLTQISEDFELIVFTASQRSYADAVLNYLDPNRTLIHHRLYRDSCVVSEKVHIKDLRVLANRSLKDVVLVDNASYSFGYQIDNGIPIVSWHYDPDDKELMYLTEYLKGLLNTDDVREVNQATFHLATFYNDYSEEFLPKTAAARTRK